MAELRYRISNIQPEPCSMDDAAQPQATQLLKRGLIGTLIAAVCCFTPILVYLFIGAGLASLTGGLDYFLFPMLFASLGLVAYALHLRAGSNGSSPNPVIMVLVVVFSVVLIWLEFKYALRISLAATVLVAVYGFYLRRETAKK